MTFVLINSETGRWSSFYGQVHDESPPPPPAGFEWKNAAEADLSASNQEPPEVYEMEPSAFPAGIETDSVIWPKAPGAGNDWESHVVDGVLVTDQVSASPRKSKAERAAIKDARMARVTAAKASLPDTLEKIKDKDAQAAVRIIAEMLNLI